jgi:hypothetical protein
MIDVADYTQRYQQGDKDAGEILFKVLYSLTHRIVRATNIHEKGEKVQGAVIDLIRAAKHYKPEIMQPIPYYIICIKRSLETQYKTDQRKKNLLHYNAVRLDKSLNRHDELLETEDFHVIHGKNDTYPIELQEQINELRPKFSEIEWEVIKAHYHGLQPKHITKYSAKQLDNALTRIKRKAVQLA